MDLIKTQSECPYCKCKDLKYIGKQEGPTSFLLLANCTNPNCLPHTIVIAIEKKGAS